MFNAGIYREKNLTRFSVPLHLKPHNQKAIGLYEKLGFEIEGTKRKAGIRGGKYIDEYIMARLRDI